MDFKKPEPLNLDGNLKENWKKFKIYYEIFAKATKTTAEEQSVQVARFLACAGPEAIELYNTFVMTEADRKDVKKVQQKFEEYCNPRTNIIYERYLFYKRDQKEGEPFDHFLKEISTMVDNCEFGTEKENMLRDRIVIGISDRNTQTLLLKQDSLTLAKAIEVCRIAEITSEQSRVMQNDPGAGKSKSSVDAVSRGSCYKAKFKNNINKSRTENCNSNFRSAIHAHQSETINKGEVNVCRFCNFKHKKGKCPAYGKKCLKCGKINHFASACKNRKQQVSDIACENEQEGSVEWYIDSVTGSNRLSYWHEKLIVENISIDFKLDTGSQVNILPRNIYEKIKNRVYLKKSGSKLEAYGGFTINILGIINGETRYKNKVFNIDYVVVDFDAKPLLGLDTCNKLGILKRTDSIDVADKSLDNFIKRYDDVFSGTGRFPDKCTLELTESAIPVSKPPRRIPLAIQDKVKQVLKEMEAKHVISKVDSSADWSHNMVVLEKKDKTVRICLDPRELNKALKEEHFLIPKIEDFRIAMRGMKYFTVLDLREGFWQLELDEKSRKLTVFSSPFGSFQYNVMPFGVKVAPEKFQKLNSKYFGHLPGVFVYIDDLIIGGRTLVEHDENLTKVMDCARKLNIKFNPKKIQYRVQQVKYLGHIFSSEGISPDPDRIEAIMHIQKPNNCRELQKILGMLNFLRPFIPNLAELTSPFRQLLKKNIEFLWTESHTLTLQNIKAMLKTSCILHSFDPDLPVVIQTDASKNGLGCCLLQNNKPISYASRSLTETETHYAQIEKELLGIVYGCIKFHDYIYGRHISIHTDHKPLVSIMSKPLEKHYSVRIQRMKIKLLRYDLEVHYKPGKDLLIADLLSRNPNPSSELNSDDILTEVVHSVNMSSSKKEMYVKETAKDHILVKLQKLYYEGWPKSKQNLEENLKFYWGIKDKIYVEDGLVFYEDRIFVPKRLIQETLKALHECHFGITKTYLRAKSLFYWPYMQRDIENMINRCSVCEKYHAKNKRQSLMPHEVPRFPYQKIGCDILDFGGKPFLVVIDYFSRWLDLRKLPNKSASSIIEALKEIFSSNGIPEIVICDNQPFNSFQCKQFANAWNFNFVYSSPHYPRSNGLAEKAVHISKQMLRKALQSHKDINMFLLEYRTTVIPSLGFSPSQLLNSRCLRTKHPVKEELLLPKILNFKDVRDKMNKAKQKQKFWYDKSAVKKEINFKKGTPVVYIRKGKWEPAIVESKCEHPRSYLLRNEQNRILRRNTFHLRRSYNLPLFKTPIDSELVNDPPDNTQNRPELSSNSAIGNDTQNNQKPDKQSHYKTRYGRTIKKPQWFQA